MQQTFYLSSVPIKPEIPLIYFFVILLQFCILTGSLNRNLPRCCLKKKILLYIKEMFLYLHPGFLTNVESYNNGIVGVVACYIDQNKLQNKMFGVQLSVIFLY